VSADTLVTDAPNTWCPGCGNFAIQHMAKQVVQESGIPRERIVLAAGIGCHGKLVDYLDLNSFYAIHGRAIPAATGIALARPDLKVICFAGDGDAYGEGLDHLLFAAKRNVDMSVVIHNNRVYGLTTGQYTPTSPPGFRGRSTPQGNVERPLNPLELVLASGGTYLARGYTRNLPNLKQVLAAAIAHRGFSFVDVLQICATFYDIHGYYDQRVYELAGHDTTSYDAALGKIREWDYSRDAPIALGTFYAREEPTFAQRLPRAPPVEDRMQRIRRRLDAGV
jgi:2-oxoglutarate ferredoxin oxidoreductase subunit beta